MLSRVTLIASALVLAASVAAAHPPGHRGPVAPKQAPPAPPPATSRNLQVLPADISQARLMATMQGWSRALGVQCSHCHALGNFASDANGHKEIARGMVRLTNRINNELLPPVVGPSREERVDCATCHRGAAIPQAQPAGIPGARPARPGDAPPAHIARDTPARPH